MNADNFQFLNQEYTKVFHKNDEIFSRDPAVVRQKICIYIFSHTIPFFQSIYLKFGYYKNTGYFYVNTNPQNFLKCLV